MGRGRWDTDERGHGVASGQAFAPNVAELGEAMADPGWVTEDPEAHLLPHLEAACSEADAPLRIVSSRSEGEIFVVELEARDGTDPVGQLRRAAVALAATIAEESTHIRQRREDGVIEFDVVTGWSLLERASPRTATSFGCASIRPPTDRHSQRMNQM